MENDCLSPAFLPHSEADWRSAVDKVLKGADFDKKLVGKSYDGIAIKPLYGKAAQDAPRALATQAGPWVVSQRVDHPDPAEANALALADLEGGASGLALVLAEAPSARGFGVAVTDLASLERVLNDVLLDLVEVRIETAPFQGRPVAALVAALAEKRKFAPASLKVDFGLDPVGDLVRTGASPLAWEALSARFAGTVKDLVAAGFKRTLARVDARAVHEAGGSQAQELAYALATGVAYLRALEAAGLPLEVAREALSVLLVADDDQFFTIAKFRALRRLWARVEAAIGLPPQPLRVAAETAWRETTKHDPWVNMLRVTVSAFAAGIGGADSVTVLPFTSALGLPDAFARRIARNTQLILLEESNLWRVADPAAGAGSVETLTEELAERAWAAFQAIETEGGIVASLSKGTFQGAVAAVRAEREKAIAKRKDAITGLSEYPNVHEAPVEVLDAKAPASPAAGGTVLPAEASFADLVAAAASGATLPAAPAAASLSVAPLPSQRLGEVYEALRDASDARFEASGTRPKVFLANLGTIAAFTARATFAKNFFETGGIEALSNDGFPSLDALVEAFKGSGAKIAVLCSSDDVYKAEAGAAGEALLKTGAAAVYLAGRPGEIEDTLKAAGVTRFIFAGADVIATLQEAAKLA